MRECPTPLHALKRNQGGQDAAYNPSHWHPGWSGGLPCGADCLWPDNVEMTRQKPYKQQPLVNPAINDKGGTVAVDFLPQSYHIRQGHGSDMLRMTRQQIAGYRCCEKYGAGNGTGKTQGRRMPDLCQVPRRLRAGAQCKDQIAIAW